MDDVDDAPQSRPFPLRLVAFIAVVLVLFVGMKFLPLAHWINAFNAWVGHLGWKGLVVFGLGYAAAAILFVPGSLLTPAAGFIFGLGWGTVAVSGGSTLGAAGGFLVARYIARSRVETHARDSAKFRAIDQAIGLKGWKIVALLRLSPVVPYTLSNYFFGLTAVRFWPYVLSSWVAMLPGTIMYVYFGVAAKAGLEVATGSGGETSLLKRVMYGVGLAATVIVTIYVTRVAKAALRETAIVQSDGEGETGAHQAPARADQSSS